jgi:hypothetical protein
MHKASLASAHCNAFCVSVYPYCQQELNQKGLCRANDEKSFHRLLRRADKVRYARDANSAPASKRTTGQKEVAVIAPAKFRTLIDDSNCEDGAPWLGELA